MKFSIESSRNLDQKQELNKSIKNEEQNINNNKDSNMIERAGVAVCSKTEDVNLTTYSDLTRKLVNKEVLKFSKIPESHRLKNANNMDIRKREISKQIKLLTMKPLRQINIVGQLNHSKSNSFLLIVLNLIVLLTISLQALQTSSALGWPFNGLKNVAETKSSVVDQITSALSIGKNATGKRITRALLRSNKPFVESQHQVGEQGSASSSSSSFSPDRASKLSPPAPPISQQYHYFWNHDQIDPKLMADEANKILADAHVQTEQKLTAGESILMSSRQSAGQNEKWPPTVNKRQDSMMEGSLKSPVVIPQEIQQQLTGLVLQMQKQQQMSMMMQPQFDNGILRRQSNILSSTTAAMNPTSRFWLATSNQHPMFATTPVADTMMASSSLINPQVHHNDPTQLLPGQRPSPSMATVAGVPVFGPFLVGPSMSTFSNPIMPAITPAQVSLMPSPMRIFTNPMQTGNMMIKPAPSSHVPSAKSSGSSFFANRRKSWPLFGALVGSSGNSFSLSNSEPSSSSSGAGLFSTAASQLRPTIALPSSPSVSFAAATNPQLSLNSEAVALIDAASNQLINAIANQLQVKATQQKLAAAIAQSTNLPSAAIGTSREANQATASSNIVSAELLPPYNTQKPLIANSTSFMKLQNLQPPYHYNVAPTNIFPAQIALDIAAANLPLLAASAAAAAINSIPGGVQELQNSLIHNATSFYPGAQTVPFGSRLKKRHLNTLASQQSYGSPVKSTTKTFDDHFLVDSTMKGETFVVPQYGNELITLDSMTQESIDSARKVKPTELAFIRQPAPPKQQQQLLLLQPSIHNTTTGRARIVKKDSPSLSNLTPGSVLPVLSKSKKTKKPLVVTSTELPSREVVDSLNLEQQTQLRRLKRSLDSTSTNLVNKFSHRYGSNGSSSSWKSMDIKPEIEISKESNLKDSYRSGRVLDIPKVSYSSNKVSTAWSPFESNSDGILKRQAEIIATVASISLPIPTSSPSTTSTSTLASTSPNNVIASTPAYEFISQPMNEISPINDKSFKVKKLNGGASVIHHQKKNFDKSSGSRRGIVITSATTTEMPKIFVKPKILDSLDMSQVDPMSLSLSESARVVNYFQNVENELPSTQAPSYSLSYSSSPPTVQQTQQTPVQQQQHHNHQQQQQQHKQLNEPQVGFSAPTKQKSTLNSDSFPADDLKRQQVTSNFNRAQLGNSANSRAMLSYPDLGPALTGGSFESTNNNQRQHSASANSADISSAASGNSQATFANLGSATNQRSALIGNLPGQLPISDSGQIGAGGLARASSNFQASQLKTGPLSIQATASVGKDNSVPAFGATSYNRQSFVAPNGSGGRSVSSLNNNQQPDRLVSADQSAIYNSEELLLPNSGSNTESTRLMTQPGVSELNPNQETQQPQPQQQQQQQQQAQQQSSAIEQQSQGSFGGTQASDVLANGEQTGLDSTGSVADGLTKPIDLDSISNLDPNSMELSRFNQQLQQQLSSAQTQSTDTLLNQESPVDQLTPSTDAASSVNLLASALSQLQQQQDQSVINSQMPPLQQQQIYSQQMQALGNAVNNYNQQRFNQHLREAASSLSQQQSKQAFQQQQQQQRQQLMGESIQRNFPSAFQKLQNSGALFQAEDATAAASAAAAAGIPTLPTISQLLALQSQGHNLNLDFSNLLTSGSEKREQQADEPEHTTNKGTKKQPKKKGFKQVSHHYHFNTFSSPFEDPENQFGPLNPVDIAGSLQNQQSQQQHQHQQQATRKPNDDKQEEEEEKPKKKSIFRRFSLKNLFKKFKKDKKKETSNESSASDDSSNSNNSNNESEKR